MNNVTRAFLMIPSVQTQMETFRGFYATVRIAALEDPKGSLEIANQIIEDAKKTIGIINKIAIARMLQKVDGPAIEARKVISDALGKAWVEQKKQEYKATRPRNLL